MIRLQPQHYHHPEQPLKEGYRFGASLVLRYAHQQLATTQTLCYPPRSNTSCRYLSSILLRLRLRWVLLEILPTMSNRFRAYYSAALPELGIDCLDSLKRPTTHPLTKYKYPTSYPTSSMFPSASRGVGSHRRFKHPSDTSS